MKLIFFRVTIPLKNPFKTEQPLFNHENIWWSFSTCCFISETIIV